MIDHIIDRDYFTIRHSADPAYLAERLRERGCLAVMDEELHVIGIITLTDICRHAKPSLDRIDFKKPVLTPRTSISKAIRLMKLSESFLLPVYRGKKFVGTIALIDLAEFLVSAASVRRTAKTFRRPDRPISRTR